MKAKEKLYMHLQTMDVVELFGYINEVEMGYISVNYHPEDSNLVIFNYTELATYEKRWNKYTMSARGLILDLTEARDNGIIYILAKPFEKFPNYGTNEIEGYEDDIDFTKIKTIMEKMDGSLGISYFFNDEIRWATRGSFTSAQAKKATEIWREKYAVYFENIKDSMYIYFPYTLLVEIIYPENRVVVDYNGFEDLVLLGANDIYRDDIEVQFQPSEWSYTSLQHYATDLDMPIAKQYEFTIEQMLEMKKTISANEEGWIIRFENGKRLKIKGDEYLQVHRVIHGLSDKAKVQAWAEQRMNEYIMILPEEFRGELEDLSDKLDRLKDSLYTLLQVTFEYVDSRSHDKKSFALNVRDMVDAEFHYFMFDAKKKGSISTDKIREYIYKNYREYIEVINSWIN
jgi:RNA ligase